MSLENVRYDAFISYRHCELDSFISENLHKKLENYSLPKSVLKKTGFKKTKIERVFRDEAELPLSSNLSDPISEALDNSEFLIVICTPRLPQSQWCRKEVETFVKTHDRQHVLLVLAEGEPEESFPDILMYEDVKAKDENGNEITVRVDREPLAADCRGDNNKQRLKALDNVVLKLCAAIFGLNYDDLKQRHRERQIRRRIIAMSAALAIVTAFALTCLSFTIKISRQNRVIRDKYAGSMAAASEELLSRGLRKDAIYAVRNVLPDKETDDYNADAYYALVNAIALYETDNSYFPAGSFRIPKDTRGFMVSDDHSKALIHCDDSISVVDISTDEEMCRVDSEYSDYSVLNDTGLVYLNNDLSVIHRDLDSGNEILLGEEGSDIFYSPAGKITLVFTPAGISGFRGLKEDWHIDLEDIVDDPDYTVDDIYLTDDGEYAAFALSGYEDSWAGLIDISRGQIEKCIKLDTDGDAAVTSDGKILYICHEEEGGYILEGTDLSSDITVTCDLAGSGFYDMIMGKENLLVVSDNLSYVVGKDLNIRSAITGYAEAVCDFERENGFIILDSMGRMFCDNIYSDADRTYSLYGHEDNTGISDALFYDDAFFIKYRDSDRVVVYSPGQTAYEAMDSIGDAKAFDGVRDIEIMTDGLEGIDDISIAYTAASDDGKYIAVRSDDGILYIFDAIEKKMVKKIFNTGIILMDTIFPHLENAGVYVIESRIFDEDFNMISKLSDGTVAAVGRDGRSIVINSEYSFDTFYNIPILTYNEIIKRADEILGGYVPDEDICDKYNISQ